MSSPERIYLDNAATSWPKPPEVYSAVDYAMRQLGAPAGRGVYREANEVERLIGDARHRVAELIGAESPQRVIFTSNGTDSLNLALHGLLNRGDHVVTSAAEHNSVLRPLRALEERRDIAVTRVPCDGRGLVDPDEIRGAIQPNTRLVALVHASNVTGAIQPVEEVGAIAGDRGILYLVDAAQTLGHLPIEVGQIGAHLLAAPGHKGLLGPLGTGVLYVAPGVERQLASVRQGGTGTHSDQDWQPTTLPDKYESGNHNVPGLIGLGAALTYLEQNGGVNAIRQHELGLVDQLLSALRDIDGVNVFGPGDARMHAGVVSITINAFEPQEVATMLDTAYSVQVRSGIHCAPLMHASLGTDHSGGTVRFSPGVFTTEAEIEQAIAAVTEIASAAVPS